MEDAVSEKYKALVVDDNDVNATISVEKLNSFELEGSIAVSGTEAIRMIRENNYAFVLMDYIHRILIENSIYWTELYGSPNDILDKLTGLCQETLFELIFLVLVVTIMSRVRIGNPVIKFLGKISLETIMLNYLLIDKLFFLYIDYGISIYLAAVLAGTIISASLIYVVKNIVLERRSGLFDGKVT